MVFDWLSKCDWETIGKAWVFLLGITIIIHLFILVYKMLIGAKK